MPETGTVGQRLQYVRTKQGLTLDQLAERAGISNSFLSEVEQGRINEVLIQGNTITGRDKNNRPFTTYAPDDANLVDRLSVRNVRISAAPDEGGVPAPLGVLRNWFPMLRRLAVWLFFLRRMPSGCA